MRSRPYEKLFKPSLLGSLKEAFMLTSHSLCACSYRQKISIKSQKKSPLVNIRNVNQTFNKQQSGNNTLGSWPAFRPNVDRGELTRVRFYSILMSALVRFKPSSLVQTVQIWFKPYAYLPVIYTTCWLTIIQNICLLFQDLFHGVCNSPCLFTQLRQP